MKKLFLLFLLTPLIGFSAGKDYSGNDLSLSTKFEKIDGSRTLVGDITKLAYDQVYDSGLTNLYFSGYGYPFGRWIYEPIELGLTLPTYTNNLWRFTETNSIGEVIGTAHYIENSSEDAIQLSYTLNTTNITFSRTATEIWTNSLGFVTQSNMSQYVKHTYLDKKLSEYVSNEKLDNYDASYKIVEGLSTENQTIQLVVDTNAVPGTLNIQLPSSGRCKDWIVYVFSLSSMSVNLPPANYWIKDESVTNNVSAGVPTAFYFSQVSSTESTFSVSRQEYMLLTINPPLQFSLSRFINDNSKKSKSIRSRK